MGSKAIGFPPLIEVRQVAPADFSGGIHFAFVVNAVYGPNAGALALPDRIAARVKDGAGEGAVPFSFAAAGKPDPGPALTHIDVTGVVPDLGAFLSKEAVLVAPVLNGAGIKTKITDALGYDVPVLTPRSAQRGLTSSRACISIGPTMRKALPDCWCTSSSLQARHTFETRGREARDVVLETHSRRFQQARLRRAAGSFAAA